MRNVLVLRVERAFKHSRALLAQHQRLTSRSKAQLRLARDVFAQIEAWNCRSRQPRVNAVWKAIEISGKHGTLKERMAILMLADAFLAATYTLTGGRPLRKTRRSGHLGPTFRRSGPGLKEPPRNHREGNPGNDET